MTNMSPMTDPESETLLSDANRGDEHAIRCLLERHREPLRRMIAARLDRRLAPRLDPSDVVQETLSDAARRLPEYLRDRPLPFYPWLYRLAADRVAPTHRDHVESGIRGIGREQRIGAPSADDASSDRWGDRLTADDTAPESRLAREERRRLLARAIGRMVEADREVLALRYFDQRSFEEIAAVLGIGISAAKMRHMRALERLRILLEAMGVEPSNAS